MFAGLRTGLTRLSEFFGGSGGGAGGFVALLGGTVEVTLGGLLGGGSSLTGKIGCGLSRFGIGSLLFGRFQRLPSRLLSELLLRVRGLRTGRLFSPFSRRLIRSLCGWWCCWRLCIGSFSRGIAILIRALVDRGLILGLERIGRVCSLIFRLILEGLRQLLLGFCQLLSLFGKLFQLLQLFAASGVDQFGVLLEQLGQVFR